VYLFFCGEDDGDFSLNFPRCSIEGKRGWGNDTKGIQLIILSANNSKIKLQCNP